jgi:hypothetical protein
VIFIRSAVALFLLLLLAGCFGGKLTGKEPAELRDFKPAASMEVRWKRYLCSQCRWRAVSSGSDQRQEGVDSR